MKFYLIKYNLHDLQINLNESVYLGQMNNKITNRKIFFEEGVGANSAHTLNF